VVTPLRTCVGIQLYNTKEGTPTRVYTVLGHRVFLRAEIALRFGDLSRGSAPGEDVYAMNDWFCEGALASTLCLTRPRMDSPQAEAAESTRKLLPVGAPPIGALITAWQGLLVARSAPSRGEACCFIIGLSRSKC